MPSINFTGTRVAKYFDGKAYSGTVVFYQSPWWKVEYDDGDKEDFDADMIPPASKLFLKEFSGSRTIRNNK